MIKIDSIMIPTIRNLSILGDRRMMILIVIRIHIGIVLRILIRTPIVMIGEKGGIGVLVVIGVIMAARGIVMMKGSNC
jgi:hypothetical protein